jgi:hypothetical protein
MATDARDMLPETVTQAIAVVNSQSPTATDEHANVPGMSSKQVSTSEAATTVVARRLRKLLDFLKIDNAEFATRTRLQPSYIGRLLNGERGASGDIPNVLRDQGEERLEVAQRNYGESKADVAHVGFCLPKVLTWAMPEAITLSVEGRERP